MPAKKETVEKKSLIALLSIPLAALVIAGVLLSGKAEVNLEHHINLPTELSNKDRIQISYPRGILDNPLKPHRQIDIRLGSELKDVQYDKDIGKVLQEATRNDTVIFHLAGYGGEVETALYIINNIQNSKAHTVAIVEAPVYSGHAYIAASVNELRIMKQADMMFHTSSGYGQDCTKIKDADKTDRTVSNVEHCQAAYDNHIARVNHVINSFIILTTEEKTRIESGHDVYLSSEELLKRLGKKVYIN